MRISLAFVAAADAITAAAQSYEATWESTDQHNPAPEWFQDAKFGIYWHWGAFATPQYYNEWYPRLMYNPDEAAYSHHVETYGSIEEWGYENFILGKNDLSGNFVQFHPVLSSEGGEFDPETFVSVIADSGAKFAGPVGEHHDGFSMWDSGVNEWNSVDKSPRLDLISLFAEQIRAYNMKLLVSLHHAYNSNGYYEWVPSQSNATLQKLFGQLPKEESDQLWLDKACEVVDHVQPDIIWHDGSLNLIDEGKRLEYLAYYFNAAEEWGAEVVTTFKLGDSGFRDTSAVTDYERGGPADITEPYWLTDDSVSSSSWCYVEGIGYYSSIQMVHSLLDRVSKGGNMLLNISPTAAGAIPDEQKSILEDMGVYLNRYGEAVFSTRVWSVYGEGPTHAGGGSFTAPMQGTSDDLRFTVSKAGDILFATVLGWPESGVVSITSLNSDSGADLSGLGSVQLLGDIAGDYIDANWTQNSGSLDITLPEQPAESVAYVLKLTFNNGTIPFAR